MTNLPRTKRKSSALPLLFPMPFSENAFCEGSFGHLDLFFLSKIWIQWHQVNVCRTSEWQRAQTRCGAVSGEWKPVVTQVMDIQNYIYLWSFDVHKSLMDNSTSQTMHRIYSEIVTVTSLKGVQWFLFIRKKETKNKNKNRTKAVW